VEDLGEAQVAARRGGTRG